jgi:hypothetical protein
MEFVTKARGGFISRKRTPTCRILTQCEKVAWKYVQHFLLTVAWFRCNRLNISLFLISVVREALEVTSLEVTTHMRSYTQPSETVLNSFLQTAAHY